MPEHIHIVNYRCAEPKVMLRLVEAVFERKKLTKCHGVPISWNITGFSSLVTALNLEGRQASLTSEQLLHGTLFELPLLGEELLQGLDERVHVAQHLGDGFLFGFCGW